jgi:plastocyanin
LEVADYDEVFMATLDYWIQLENRPWDVCPNNIDRMTGQKIKDRESPSKNPVSVTLTSPGTGKTSNVQMYKPLRSDDGTALIDALILRRYLPPQRALIKPWTLPDDRKVNPWDANEHDPSDNGTMGTIPGPVIECNVGDKVRVHFHNLDKRTFKGLFKVEPLPVEMRTHSLHPHGFAFAATSDGAYPLSPFADGSVDEKQLLGGEAPLWNSLPGFSGSFKKGDRVPPDGTFTYTWIAGAPSEADPTIIEHWPSTAGVWLYHDHSICDMENVNLGAIGLIVIHNPQDDKQDVDIRKVDSPLELDPAFLPGASTTGPVWHGKPSVYFSPRSKALYLQLFHTLTGSGASMLINGRQYLGNTPTLIAGPETLMRFGVIGMGNDFHTFHIHGHRWAIPGPDGSDPDTIQNSPQVRAVSQFEDTRIFGPANSFVFTIQEGSFMGARDDYPFGEFHMHCHVLMHMDMGMMGSLLIIPKDGGPNTPLPMGVPCPPMPGIVLPPIGGGPKTVSVNIQNLQFNPSSISIKINDTVTWTNKETDKQHTVTEDTTPPAFDSSLMDPGGTFSHKFTASGMFHYHCNVHPDMHGTVNVT